MSICSSGVIIPQELSALRKALFQEKLNEVFRKHAPGCWDQIDVNLTAFMNMLRTFRDARNASDRLYGGMRIYFCCYHDQEGPTVPRKKRGFLTLCFVPTLNCGDRQQCPDDERLFYYLDEKGVPTPDADQQRAIPWRSNYQTGRLQELDKQGAKKTGNNHFEDSKSIWYSMESIAGEGDEIGLIKMVECYDPTDNPIVRMTIDFGSFLLSGEQPNFDKYPYQMTFLFNFIQKNDDVLTFSSSSVVTLFGIYADTGIPCPPIGKCPPTN